MIMFSLAFALAAQAAPATLPAPAAPAATQVQSVGSRSLKDVPGISITYHDLTEKDVKSIGKAIKNKKPLNAEQQKLMAASTTWGVSPAMTKLTKGSTCTVTKATTGFRATANLPRFNEAWIPAADLAAWRDYLAGIEQQAAAKLWFPHDRLSGFEQAVVGKSCDEALAAGTAFMNRLKADAAAFRPAAAQAAAVPATPAKQ